MLLHFVYPRRITSGQLWKFARVVVFQSETLPTELPGNPYLTTEVRHTGECPLTVHTMAVLTAGRNYNLAQLR